jgi:hypothetical protein
MQGAAGHTSTAVDSGGWVVANRQLGCSCTQALPLHLFLTKTTSKHCNNPYSVRVASILTSRCCCCYTCTCLAVQNLPKNLTEDELRALFSPYGAVIECRVLHSGTARTDSGTGAGALVRMATVDEAAQAIAHLHNQRLQGSVMPLVVRFADTQVQPLSARCLMDGKSNSNACCCGCRGTATDCCGLLTAEHAQHRVDSTGLQKEEHRVMASNFHPV